MPRFNEKDAELAPHPFHIHFPQHPVDVWSKMKLLAKREGRTIKSEVLRVVIEHLRKNGLLSAKEIELLNSPEDGK